MRYLMRVLPDGRRFTIHGTNRYRALQMWCRNKRHPYRIYLTHGDGAYTLIHGMCMIAVVVEKPARQRDS